MLSLKCPLDIKEEMLLDFAMQSQKFWEMGLAAGRNLRVVNYDNR